MASTLSRTSGWIQNLVTGLLLFASLAKSDGLAISYCSPDLTAEDFQPVYNTWQTNGACHDTCIGQYAFAILKGQNCWCSNYIPADQVSTYSCNTICPGFPSEWCGNEAEGLYGYFQLDGKAPSGTAGGSSPTSGSSVSNTPSSAGSSHDAQPTSSFGGPSSLTVFVTVQASTETYISTVETTSTVPVAVSSPVTSSTSKSSSTSSTRSSPSPSPTPTQVYTSVTTVTGQVRTVVVTPTPTDSTLGSGTQINSSGGGLSTGKVVGIVIGVALGLGLIIGLAVWFWFRKRHQRNLDTASFENTSAHSNTGIPSRQVSQMSSAGLLSKAPRITTSGLPSGINPRSADTLGSNFDRRSVGTDQRLNPYAIYAHDESRHSNISLQDNQDYSRQLRVANPDP